MSPLHLPSTSPERPGAALGVDEVKVKVSFPTLAEQRAAAQRPAYLSALRMLLGHLPFQRLLLSFMFCVLAFQVLSLRKVTFFSPSENPLK